MFWRYARDTGDTPFEMLYLALRLGAVGPLAADEDLDKG